MKGNVSPVHPLSREMNESTPTFAKRNRGLNMHSLQNLSHLSFRCMSRLRLNLEFRNRSRMNYMIHVYRYIYGIYVYITLLSFNLSLLLLLYIHFNINIYIPWGYNISWTDFIVHKTVMVPIYLWYCCLQSCGPAGSWFVLVSMQCKTATSSDSNVIFKAILGQCDKEPTLI